jgi:ATP-dependent helicase HrpA
MRHEAAGMTSEAFPHQLRLGGVDYELSYHFEPGSARDGVTLCLPLAQLNQIPAARCEWLVPGLLREKVVQLVKTLPQRCGPSWCRCPISRRVRRPGGAVRQAAAAGADALHRAVARAQRARLGDHARCLPPRRLPAHLSFNFRLLDENGRQLGMSRNLNELRAEWGREARQEFAELHETPGEYAECATGALATCRS